MLVISLSVKADFFGDIGDWFEGAWNDTGDYISHNPGISILSGLAIVSVTEPLALPWVAMGVVTPFVLGYRYIGGEVVASNAPEFISTGLTRGEAFEMGIIGGGKTVPEQLLVHDISGMFEMGTGRVLAEEFVGAAGKTIAESGAGAGSGSFDAEFFNMSKSGTSGTVFEMQEAGTSKQFLTQEMMDAIAQDVSESSSSRVTTRSLFSDLRQGKAPKSLFKQLSVNVPEELEMESVSFQDFQEAKFNFDNPGAKFPKLPDGSVWENPTSFDNPSYNFDNTSMTANFEMRQMAQQKMLKYSVSDGLSTEVEKEIDDLVERAAFNESQKTFQQMSQKESLQLAKDVYKFDMSSTYSGASRWVTPAEQSLADEIAMDSPFQTPDSYLNQRSYPTRVTISRITQTTAGKAFHISSLGSIIVGSIVGFGVSTYETIDKGVNWAKDETHWLAGAANDTYCWLKHGVYEQCDDGLITNISVDIPENKTDNDTFFGTIIPIDGIFVPAISSLDN